VLRHRSSLSDAPTRLIASPATLPDSGGERIRLPLHWLVSVGSGLFTGCAASSMAFRELAPRAIDPFSPLSPLGMTTAALTCLLKDRIARDFLIDRVDFCSGSGRCEVFIFFCGSAWTLVSSLPSKRVLL